MIAVWINLDIFGIIACGRLVTALFRARGLALADHTEALVGSVSRDRIPSGHIPLISLVFFARNSGDATGTASSATFFETLLRYPSASPASPHTRTSFVPKTPPPLLAGLCKLPIWPHLPRPSWRPPFSRGSLRVSRSVERPYAMAEREAGSCAPARHVLSWMRAVMRAYFGAWVLADTFVRVCACACVRLCACVGSWGLACVRVCVRACVRG